MRNVCCATMLLLLVTAVGCQTQFESRTYQLGPKPKAALVMIDQITMDEMKQHKDEVQEDTAMGGKVMISKVIEEEGVVVVRTTPQGHRRITAALEELQSN